MRKLTCRRLALMLACILAIGCQTTHPGTKTQAAGQAQQATTQGQQSTAAEQPGAQGQPAGQPGVAARSASGARGVTALQPGKLVQALSTRVDTLIRNVRKLVSPKAGSSRLAGTVETVTSRLRGIRLPPADLLVPIAAAVILLGGGAWTLATIIAGRRRG
jgi:hypothetical protein